MDVPESNPHGEYEEQNRKSPVNPKSFSRWLKPWSWHTFGGDRKDGGGYDSFSVSLKMEDVSLEKLWEP